MPGNLPESLLNLPVPEPSDPPGLFPVPSPCESETGPGDDNVKFERGLLFEKSAFMAGMVLSGITSLSILLIIRRAGRAC